MSNFALIFGFVLLVLIHTGLAYWHTKRLIKPTGTASKDAHITNLRVTMQLILWVLPITVVLLGILGFGSIKDLRENIVNEIQTELGSAEITKEHIELLNNDIGKLYQQAFQYVDSIKTMSEDLDLLNLPVGTIVAYYGDRAGIDEMLDKAYWAVCDGEIHHGITTPDLREKFILGADFGRRVSSSSEPIHDQLTVRADSQAITFTVPEGTSPYRTIAIPKYTKITPTNVNVNPLPPYYALVYLMKLR